MTFDPELITIIWDGDVITGYADGSTVSAQRNSDVMTPQVGLQGDVVHAKSADKTGTITFSLFDTSASLIKLRRDAQRGKKAMCTMRNANNDGGFIVSDPGCQILNVPGFSGTTTSSSVEVRIHVPKMTFEG